MKTKLIALKLICLAAMLAGCGTTKVPSGHFITISENNSLDYEYIVHGKSTSEGIKLEDLHEIAPKISEDDIVIINYPNWHDNSAMLQKVTDILDQYKVEYSSGNYGIVFLREFEEDSYKK